MSERALTDLAIARNLERIWTDVLKESPPAELQRLINWLERVTNEHHGAGK